MGCKGDSRSLRGNGNRYIGFSVGDLGARQAVAREAARLLYEGEFREYLHAKQAAAARLEVSSLPSNLEVREALLSLAQEVEGDERLRRLDAMRRAAVKLMELLVEHNPRLVGSVATGYAHKYSDIDIHLYSDDLVEIYQTLDRQGIEYTIRVVANPDDEAEVPEFIHIYCEFEGFPVEITQYPDHFLERREVCGVTGKPMLRLSIEELKALVT